MKLKLQHNVAVLLAAFIGVLPAQSGPLPKNQVSAGAKWLVHADLEGFRTTQVGKFVDKHLLAKALAEAKEAVKFDVAALVQKFTSITAYGTDYKNDPAANLATGILIIQGDADTQKVLEGMLAGAMLADTNSPLKKVQTTPFPLYSYAKQVFAAIQPNGMIVVGKSEAQIEKACQVIAGQEANLGASKAFSEFPAAPDAYFLLGVAEAFNQSAAMPPQARVLQMADGARLILGEKADRLFLDLSLKAKTADVVSQIQQVLQGIVALFALGDPGDKDLAELIKSIKVTAKDKVVSIGVEFPVQKALAKLAEEVDDQDAPKKSKSPGKKAKSKAGSAGKAESSEKSKESAEAKEAGK